MMIRCFPYVVVCTLMMIVHDVTRMLICSHTIIIIQCKMFFPHSTLSNLPTSLCPCTVMCASLHKFDKNSRHDCITGGRIMLCKFQLLAMNSGNPNENVFTLRRAFGSWRTQLFGVPFALHSSYALPWNYVSGIMYIFALKSSSFARRSVCSAAIWFCDKSLSS